MCFIYTDDRQRHNDSFNAVLVKERVVLEGLHITSSRVVILCNVNEHLHAQNMTEREAKRDKYNRHRGSTSLSVFALSGCLRPSPDLLVFSGLEVFQHRMRLGGGLKELQGC